MRNAEKVCPILMMGKAASTPDRETLIKESQCLGAQCSWFRGNEIRDENDSNAGICAISDLPGWISKLHQLAGPIKSAGAPK